jgi:hypothetical protein
MTARRCAVERAHANENGLLGAPYYCEVPVMLGASDKHRISVCGHVVRLVEGDYGIEVRADVNSRPCAMSDATDARVIEYIDPSTFQPGTLGEQ